MNLIRVPALGVCLLSASLAQSPCDLNNDGKVGVIDVQLATNMSLGVSPCTANINGHGVCDAIMVQRVINALLGQACVPQFVTLNWTPSVSSNVAGYNLYRSSTAGGPYTRLNASPIAASTFIDTSVSVGHTYYYVASTLNLDNAESGYSTEVRAVVPSP